MATFTLSSPDIPSGGSVPRHFEFDGFGCSGDNRSPVLRWSGAPAGTRSFAVNVYDPDAPTGSGWWHWVVYNLPASATSLPEGAGTADGKALPAGSAQGRTDFGGPGFGGACPPPGDKPHRYVFTVFALGVDNLHAAAGIPKTGSAALHGFVLNKGLGDKLLGKASFTATYGR